MAAIKRRPHWQAPATILIALICGVLFAVGHHLFYQSLAGNSAPSDEYNILGSSISKQQLNIAGGTAFALLVKTSLGVALTTIFIQLFWQAFTKRTSQEATLESLDTVFDGLNNIYCLFKANVWWRYPLLFLLALVAWYAPMRTSLHTSR